MKKKIMTWGGIIFAVGIAFIYLCGETTPNVPKIPLIYGTSQMLWLLVALIGAIILISGMSRKK